jgi:hypothetical protein
MEGICEQNEYRRNPKTNFTLSTESTKIIGCPMKRGEENMRP